MKTTESSIVSTSRVDDDEVVGGEGAVDRGVVGRGAIGGGAVGRLDRLKKSAKSKSQTKSGHLGNSNNSEESKFLISKAKEAFDCLKQAFTKAPIFWHFDSDYYI